MAVAVTLSYMHTMQVHHDGRRLLVTGNKRTSLNTQKTCMAEDVCVSKTCGKAYDHTSKNLPFTIDYDKIRNGDSTTFSFKVRCNETAHPCWADLQCQPHHFHISDVLPLGTFPTLSIASRHAGRT